MNSNTNVITNNNLNFNYNNCTEVWVKQWVDYSTKYGLGYILNDGCAGVYFNDTTKIVLDPTGTYIEYMERRPNEK